MTKLDRLRLEISAEMKPLLDEVHAGGYFEALSDVQRIWDAHGEQALRKVLDDALEEFAKVVAAEQAANGKDASCTSATTAPGSSASSAGSNA